MNQQKQYLNKNKKKHIDWKKQKIRFAYIIGEQEEVDKTF